MIREDYLERVYAGFLGMNIGIRLGAPVEATIWSYDRIQATYGDITAYVKDYINFAADDDANGPYYFLRALYDDAAQRDLIPQDVGRAWLNYAREDKGMFWWGGYGRSTEHTAYLNLKAGIPAPQSGSLAQNGATLAEQIGGQIFIDTWGLVSPGNPEQAVRLGVAAASVSHDGEGLEGARFFCAAIALAFEERDIYQLVRKALSFVGPASTYRAVAEAVIAFHQAHPDDWRACRDMLTRDWGYDRYPGVCHIIPNAGVCVLALLYGGGDFARTVEIATMSGWDTDCNAGNVGTVLGVMTGLTGLPARYRDPIGDSIVLSGITGSLNMLDIPTYAKELALLGYRLAKQPAPQALLDSYREREIFFDFELPGSTHNFRVSDPFFSSLSHSEEVAFAGKGSLCVLIDRANRGEGSRVFYKPFYCRDDFSDERYSPVFSPRAYSGQTVSFQLYLDQWEGSPTILVAPYVRLATSRKILRLGDIALPNRAWQEVRFTIPDSQGEAIDEVGFLWEGNCKSRSLGKLYLDEFRIFGPADYTIDMTRQRSDFGCMTPYSHNHGAWSVENGTLHAISCGFAESYTGWYFAGDGEVSCPVTPENGEGHMLAIRAQGAQRGYFLGLSAPGKAAICKNDFGIRTLAEVDFPWVCGQTYELRATAIGGQLTLCIDGQKVLVAEDGDHAYGMHGLIRLGIGRTRFGNVHYRDL